MVSALGLELSPGPRPLVLLPGPNPAAWAWAPTLASLSTPLPLLPCLTYSTSSPRRARKAPSSMQLIWFLSSCL